MINSSHRTESFKRYLLHKLIASGKARYSPEPQGFTLTEVLVVMIILVVLFGIAAPGWLGFMSRQRVNGAQTEVLQVLRETQNLAITKRASYSALFTNENNEAVVSIFAGDPADGGTLLKEETLGKRDGGKASVQLTTLPVAATSIMFNFDGGVDLEHLNVDTPPEDSLYKVIVSPAAQANPRSCVIVDTILGAMREGRGAECDP